MYEKRSVHELITVTVPSNRVSGFSKVNKSEKLKFYGENEKIYMP